MEQLSIKAKKKEREGYKKIGEKGKLCRIDSGHYYIRILNTFYFKNIAVSVRNLNHIVFS